ncbi:MAG: GNAT family N-acetyltransferase [Planctomycetota bacterium]|jgi:CelD/BcsL family acetyltransferase involved in cellulose biosynthesis
MKENVSQQDQSIDLRIIKGAESVSEFADAWDDLFDRAADAPPYLARLWAKTFIEEGKLPGSPLFVLAWCDAKLVALFPLAIRKSLSVKIAAPIGTGEGAYYGLLLDSDYRSVIARMADLITSEKLFDVYYSEDLSSEDVATNELLGELKKKGYSCRRVSRSTCLWIRLGCSFDKYLKKKITKSKRRYKLRYEEKKLYESGDVQVTHYIGREITPEVNRRVADIQLESWMKRRGGAILGQPFYQKLLANMIEGGFGHVWLMTIDGEDAAFAYSFIAHGQHHYYWPAFKLKYESSLSIGQMLLMHVIRDSCEDGILSFDFIHGDAAYKRFWATDSYSVHRIAAGRGLSGRLIAGAYYVIWRLGRNEWLRSTFRHIRARTHRLKQRTA